MTKHCVYLGVGSNLDQPIKQIETALAAIDALPQTHLKQSSRLYGSKPLGPQDQPDFVNAVCCIETALSPQALLEALQHIEQTQGRIKKRHWGERCIDLDILLYDDWQISDTHLQVPHREIAERDFVLVPLAEISPGLLIPGKGPVEGLISQLTETYVIPLQTDQTNLPNAG